MSPPRHGRWACMVLSGLVYPGLGQLAQQRKLAAWLIIPVFTVLICTSLYFIFHVLLWQVQWLLGQHYEQAGLDLWLRALISLGITLFAHALNVLDVWLHDKNA